MDKFKILYALSAYCKQIGVTDTNLNILINNHASVAEDLVNCFESRFNPNSPIKSPILKSDIKLLDPSTQKLASILYNLIAEAIVRTNYFYNNPILSFKVNLSLFDQSLHTLPKPVTFREIFIFSEEFEAIHLRNGKIARGGLRWSDRTDFRTEILGLVKTQNTKNTVVVPVGSKGGFLIKKYPEGATKEEKIAFGKECYKKFISSLLEITDNVVHGEIQNPKNVVLYDENDPYLAVAADKGTAKFSDIANAISEEYQFWLGDAFASGGSNGYNHKNIAITSQGTWLCTERHFRELGINVSKEEFTVVGVGDMSGDVFGNGLLRSRKAKLIFAFNHMNIFVDPNPNPETSFVERERLFKLPSSTWENYDLSVASKGAKIFKRSDKICELTPEIQSLFNIQASTILPEDLIKIALKSKFDLFWSGGVGTYIKAEFETDKDVGDKTNDILRINGKELGARVVGEGGNLGLTQYGRVEFALNGGKINTDAIDNSAGVDCSDHEVNIKILLNALVRKGQLLMEERNEFIHSLTQDVCKLTLKDNYNQSLSLSLEKEHANLARLYPEFIKDLEQNVNLDIKNEKLPTPEQVKDRGLTRPEIAILLAYSKMRAYNDLISSDLIKDKYFEKFLINYFPLKMRERFLPQILSHQLKYEIVSTVLSNKFANFGGIELGFALFKISGKSLNEVIKAYFIAENVIRLESVFEDIKNSDYKIPSKKQYEVLNTIQQKILIPAMIKILNSYDLTQSMEVLLKEVSKEIKSAEINKDDLTFVNV